MSEKVSLAIDTSCDETAAAVTKGVNVYSNIVWSQASLHHKWGGVYPNLAKRAHQERIDFVIKKAVLRSGFGWDQIDDICVTIGPGLAVSLEVGIKKAISLSKKHNLPVVAGNHIEGHILSPLASSKNSKESKNILFPALGMVFSGGTSVVYLIERPGKYRLVAQTLDDALGEALDKAARMLGLGYPGGAVLEKFAKEGNPNRYDLPIPLVGTKKLAFSYSGLKTAMFKVVEKEKPLDQRKIKDLAASFQKTSFLHVEKILKKIIKKESVKSILLGGGVASNILFRKKLRAIAKTNGLQFCVPYTKKLCTDNAAMIGVASYLIKKNKPSINPEKLDRKPRLKL